MPSTRIPTSIPAPDFTGIRLPMPQLYLECVSQTARLGQELGLAGNWSVLGAHTMHGALHALGHSSAHVIGVAVGAFNPALTDAVATGPAHAAWPDTAYVCGIAGTDQVTAEGWDGHAVLLVTERTAHGNRKWLLDPTLDQYSSPDHGLLLGPSVARANRDFLAGELMEIALRSGSSLLYQRRPSMTGHRDLGSHADRRLLAGMVTTLINRLQS